MGNPITRESFATIDDAISLAQELLTRLTKLGEYKHPLLVRRGFRKGVDISMADEKESRQIKGGGRTYFLDIEETAQGKPYLRITESRKEKRGDKFERKSLHVFPEDAAEFGKAVAEMTAKLGDEKPEEA